MKTWQAVGAEVELECRAVLLKRQFLERTYMASVFSALKQGVVQSKKVRMIRQAEIFDAWRQYIQTKRHTLAQNVSMFNFEQANKKYMIRVCFNALLHNK